MTINAIGIKIPTQTAPDGTRFKTHEFDLSEYRTPEACAALFRLDAAEAPGGGNIGESALEGGRIDFFFGSRRGSHPAMKDYCAEIIAKGDLKATERLAEASSQAEALAVQGCSNVRPAWSPRRVTGQRFDLERVLASDSHPWGRWESGKRLKDGTKIVSLYISVGGNCNLSAEQMAWSPVAGVIMADILEKAGYRVEIWGVWATSNGDGIHRALRFSLKHADQPLDLNALTRCCNSPVIRGVIFCKSMVIWGFEALGSSYGRSAIGAANWFDDENGITVRMAYNLKDSIAEIKRLVALFQ